MVTVEQLKEPHLRFSRSLACMLVATMLSAHNAERARISDRSKRPRANYLLLVSEELVDVTVQKDGSVDIHYFFSFTNVDFLDGVDIGMPNAYYDYLLGLGQDLHRRR